MAITLRAISKKTPNKACTRTPAKSAEAVVVAAKRAAFQAVSLT